MRGLAERNVRRGLRRQLGLTLIETMIVLAIAAVAIALVLKPVRGALSSMRSSDEVGELPTIITNIQKIYASRSTFAGLTQATVVNRNAFPISRVQTGTTNLVNRWSGTITVAPVSIGGGANNGVSLTYTNMPASDCSDIVGQVDDNVRIVTVNGTITKADGQQSNQDAVGTACIATDPATVVYQFSK
jgi:prepilin-type N-terminal cleavage/methylation domain-containing protein